MPLDGTYDGYVLRYRHSDGSFVLTEPEVAGTPPTVVSGFTTYLVAASATSRVINRPTSVGGDYIFAVYASDGDLDVATMSGFTKVYTETNFLSNTGVFSVFYKVHSGSEPASYTLTNTVSERGLIVSWAVRGMSSFNVFGTPTVGNTGTPTFPALTTTVPNTLRFNIATSYRVTTPYGTMAGYTLMTEQNVSSGGSIAVFYKDVPTAGVDAGISVTQTTTESTHWGQVSFAVAP